MKRFVQGFLVSVSLFFIGISSVSGGGNTNLAPFPVPLDCYVEDQNSMKFIEKNCNRVNGIENFKDPDGASVGEILSSRISANSFNLVVSVIFLLAILHTFMANKLTAKAHLIHEEHDERMKKEGASEEEIKHDIPFKAELCHFLGEGEVIFGI